MEIFSSVIPISLLFFFFPFISIYLISDSKFSQYFIDIPEDRKVHSINIPRIGGFCVLVGFFLTILVLLVFNSSAFLFWINDSVGKSIILAAVIVFIIGFFDDTTFFSVNALQKMLVQFVIAISVVFGFGLYISEVNFLGRIYQLGYFGEILTVIWIVGVMNAFNIIDGVDGLLGGLTLITLKFATVLFLFVGVEYQNYMLITIPMIAVIFAFLKYNYSPAVIFAGDSGSLFFGAVAAILSVKIGTLANEGIESLSVFYIVALPVIEVFVSMVRRYYYGSKKYKSIKEKLKEMLIPDNRHMHHRLVNKGYSHERVFIFLMFLSFLFALCSVILMFPSNPIVKVCVFLYSIYVFICIINYLGYIKGKKSFENKNLEVEKCVFVYTDNGYFEKSIYSAASENYRIEKFESIYEEYKKKNIESFIIYNDNDNFIERDIEKIYEIRKLFNSVIFFISKAENLSKYSYILDNEKNIYFMKKPVDITMLVHNIDRISYSGNVYGDIYFDKNENSRGGGVGNASEDKG